MMRLRGDIFHKGRVSKSGAIIVSKLGILVESVQMRHLKSSVSIVEHEITT